MYYRRNGTLFANSIAEVQEKGLMDEFVSMWEGKEGDDYRRVAYTEVGRFYISTLFLGIDHNFTLNKELPGYKPILFETMVFEKKPKKYKGDALFKDRTYHPNEWQTRYCTELEASIAHEHLVKIYRHWGWLPKFIRTKLIPKLYGKSFNH